MNASKILNLNVINFDRLNNELKQGAVLCFVTDTVWGLGCLPSSKEGIDKIYEIKGRDRSKPLILMSDNVDNLRKYLKPIPVCAENAIEKHFPGGLTVISEKSDLCSDDITSNMNTVGIRVPDNSVFSLLCSKIDGHVLATTSANKSGETPVKNMTEAIDVLGDSVDYIIDDMGEKPMGVSSTVALFSDGGYKVLRQGTIVLGDCN